MTYDPRDADPLTVLPHAINEHERNCPDCQRVIGEERAAYLTPKPGVSRGVLGWLFISIAVLVLAAIAAALLVQGIDAAPSSAPDRPAPSVGVSGRPAPGQSGAPLRASGEPAAGLIAGRKMAPRVVDTDVAVGELGGVPPLPDTATSVRGTASWYCGGGSACTRGYPPGTLAAAAGPALRVGDWRGRIVKVCAKSKCVRVALVDWCACGHGRVIDLYRAAFARLASPSRGVLRVEVTWGGTTVVVPPTSTEP